MSIFESLENLNVSEECFNEIMTLIEKEVSSEEKRAYINKFMKDTNNIYNNDKELQYSIQHPNKKFIEKLDKYMDQEEKRPLDQEKIEQNKKLHNLSTPEGRKHYIDVVKFERRNQGK